MTIHNFHHVENGIYRGGELSDKDLELLKQVYGMKRIISLDPEIGSRIDPIVKNLKMEHLMLPIDSSSTVFSGNLRYIYNNLRTLFNLQPVYVHCKHGADRTGLVIGLYRVKVNNWTCEQALAEARRYQFGVRISPAIQKFYQNLLCLGQQGIQVSAVDDKDIVQRERGEAILNTPPAFNPMQSWMPPHVTPEFQTHLQQTRRQMMEDLANAYDMPPEQEIPMVGQHSDTTSAMRGFGPVTNSGTLGIT